ncbi:MAG: metabolite traffic protein EboE [Planctomycetes bacterium]|nr:metabolite traffic protein EboE [Planctomycetota bacterium]
MPPTLTYCTNLLPAESAVEVLGVLGRLAMPLRTRLSLSELPIGLYLSDAATRDLSDPRALELFESRLAEMRVRIVTLNAFPFGGFHNSIVKENVFRPTWGEPPRREYTERAARLLARWIPRGSVGSVSTHTGSHKSFGVDAESDDRFSRAWIRTAIEMARLEEETGRRIVVSIEPEPHSRLETTKEVVHFFERLWLAPLRRAAAEWSVNPSWLEAKVRRHIGVCFDVCHQAVEFEDCVAALARLRAAGIPIGKIQASVAPALAEPAARPQALAELESFAEPRWLHQSFCRNRSGEIESRRDLPEALSDLAFLERAEELRTHFHIPVFLTSTGALATTREELERVLASCGPVTDCVEIETYTMAAVPGFRGGDDAMIEVMAREWSFAAGLLGA